MLDIREIRDMDVPEIQKLEQKIFPDPWSENGLRESLRLEYTVLLGAWDEGILCGYVIFYSSFDEGEIARIAVSEAYRRQGIAGRLLLELENFCREKKILKMMLDVRESNKGAIRFYKKHGFTEDGIRKNYYPTDMNGNTRHPEDAILMSRELGK